MIRTQIYLTEDEHKMLKNVSNEIGQSMSALIRGAVDNYIQHHAKQTVSNLERLKSLKGTWSETDINEVKKIRSEFDRFPV
jgi:predicted RNA binding protein with dsRBD fold (UPF0201 family)